ncbi:hypothetical protein L7F22_053595 [Adiantum nelumboides]|nr:hypothetical protein [Adiantum nelumboides]
MKPDCPQRQKKKEPAPPSSNSIPDVQGNTDQEKGKRQLLKGWGSLNNERVLILYDPGSTDNFISLDTANRLNLSTDKLGTPVTSGSAFEGLTTNCTPVQEKLNLLIGMLGLVPTIKDRANEIYKKVEDLKSIRGRNQDAILAACLYIACRQEDKPRTVKEICSVANGASKKEIGRAKEFIVKQLEEEMGKSMEMGTIHAGDFLRRFCSHLGMGNQSIKAATEAVKKSEELDVRRSPISIAAAAIYMISQLSDDKKPLKDISRVTGVAEGTIRNSYKDLYPHAAKIIPDWFSKDEDLRNLCAP